ncbi:MAG: BolA family transcriptional regulator [Alphaproteobacteria bacterium]|nr:BolA family transcriptional regulator [Alphaproteobacteria bacterium]MBU0859444.1 BolA family transcriptional regulator [Alphaproteobacteria bacterium]
MSMEETIKSKLTAALAPVHLRVENQSHLHAGHSGDDGSGESHFHVEITAQAFAGQSRVACHRMVHDILEDDIKARIHALSIKAEAP